MSSFETESDGASWQYNSTEKEIESKGKFGFYLNNNFSFPINKFLAFKTGFGLSVNNVDLKTNYTYSGIQGFYYDTANIYFSDSGYRVYGYSRNAKKSNYNIFSLRIPVQLQFGLLKQRLLLSGGFSLLAILRAKNTREVDSDNSYTYIEEGFENVFFNVCFGADYLVYKNLYAGIHYERSITNMERNSSYSYYPNQTQYKLHLNSLSLNLTWVFGESVKQVNKP
jgi:hypothetical protein